MKVPLSVIKKTERRQWKLRRLGDVQGTCGGGDWMNESGA